MIDEACGAVTSLLQWIFHLHVFHETDIGGDLNIGVHLMNIHIIERRLQPRQADLPLAIII